VFQVPDIVRRFLDVEAEDDADGLDGEEDGDDDDFLGALISLSSSNAFSMVFKDFIDTTVPIAGGSGFINYASWNAHENGDQDHGFAALLDRAYQRSRIYKDGQAPIISDILDIHIPVREQPNSQDYPLWRVGCRVNQLFTSCKPFAHLFSLSLRKRPSFICSKRQMNDISCDLPLLAGHFEAAYIWKGFLTVLSSSCLNVHRGLFELERESYHGGQLTSQNGFDC
jgi:hypothetical protein